jgi:PadR family transcriptional regulator PadR
MPGWNHRRRAHRHARRAAGMLESVLLLLVHQEPAHGYALVAALDEYGLGAVDPSAAYRTLRDMEDRGWVTSAWDGEQALGPPRRVYRITDAGDEILAAWMQELEETQGMLHRLLEAYHAHMATCQGEHYPRRSTDEAGRGS